MHAKHLVTALALVLASAPALADGDPLAAALQKVVEQQVATFNAENVAGSMATIHTASPEYRPTQEELGEVFPEETLKAELVSFQYVGHDDEFAVARVKLKVGAPKGDEFVDNVSDTMMLFHQENGAWRVWGDYLIGVQTLE